MVKAYGIATTFLHTFKTLALEMQHFCQPCCVTHNIRASVCLSVFLSPIAFCLTIVDVEGYWCMWSHTMTHSQAVGLPWTSDRPVAEGPSCNNAQHSREKNTHTVQSLTSCFVDQFLHCTSICFWLQQVISSVDFADKFSRISICSM